MEPETYVPFEENEISLKANGGTELIKRKVASLVDPTLASNFQVICSRVRQIRQDKIRIYWIHDLPEDDETKHIATPDSMNRFHRVVFCGEWQKEQYLAKLNLPQDRRLLVIENGIDPLPRHTKPQDEINLIYVASPQRGLGLLYTAFVELVKRYPNIKLHVFSSFNIYGWGHADESDQFKPLFEAVKSHPSIIYHGTKSNAEVREQMTKSHILAYPSIWRECNSIGLIESMSAGLLCVHPNYAGLSDTCGKLTQNYQWVQDPNQHATVFFENMCHAIEIVNKPETQNYLDFVKTYADVRFNIGKVVHQWTNLMTECMAEHPTVETRAVPKMRTVLNYNPFGVQ